MSGNVLPKPVENKWKISFRWLIQALQRIHRCFQNTSPPWTHKACTVNRLQKTCVQVPDKSHYRVRREKVMVHSGGKPARELVRSTR